MLLWTQVENCRGGMGKWIKPQTDVIDGKREYRPKTVRGSQGCLRESLDCT